MRGHCWLMMELVLVVILSARNVGDFTLYTLDTHHLEQPGNKMSEMHDHISGAMHISCNPATIPSILHKLFLFQPPYTSQKIDELNKLIQPYLLLLLPRPAGYVSSAFNIN